MPVSSRATRAFERVLVLVEDGQLVVFGQILIDVPIGIEDRDGLLVLG
jgi:hypothetical protein